MNYLIHQENMDELNAIVGQQGGPIPSKVSDALAEVQIAIAEGNDDKANAALNKAIEANKLSGAAWDNVQEWHDDRINEDQYEGDDGGKDPGGELPAIPSNAIQMFPGKDGHLLTQDGKDITVRGKNYAAHVTGGTGATGQVYYFKANYDAPMASMSCDGKKIAFTVTDSPSDPGEPYNANTAYANGYKKGQCCNFRIGEGGYHHDTTAIFSIT
jgi:hypothetical protein